MRLKHEDLDALKEKFKVDRIWSFSRISTFLECPWAYNMLYIEKRRVNTDNVYTIFGSECHEIIQEYLAKKIDRAEMSKLWNSFVKKWEDDPTSFQFDTKKIESGYLDNLTHYFKHTEGLNYPVRNEKPVIAKLHDKDGKLFVFVGYVDSEYTDEDGNLHLIDFKTSSKTTFTPKNLPKKSMQLLLYAIAEHQRTGISYDKIKCKFDMQKYCSVHYQLESGKWKTSAQERSQWVAKMANKLKTKLPKADVDPITAEEMIKTASHSNTMDNLPESIQKQFFVTNYYIEVKISEETCDKLERKITGYCNDIHDLENKDDIQTYLEINYPYDPDNFYCKKLCAYHSSREFKEENGMIEPEITESLEVNDIFGGEEDKNVDDDDLLNLLLK
ncbi:MAG: PD-(D/E)XK nuclease family protein [Liquorilactobacillus hordei]|uniref:PD-(D/E)XK nuclease family protein n=1 Tax=Liquorilactobacillus hordei TaxID=468911 RepID=UPI0039ED7974